MPLTNIGHGRNAICKACPEWAWKKSWGKWPRCWITSMILDYLGLNGPATNCPNKLWDDAQPIDVAAIADARAAKKTAEKITEMKVVVDILSPDEKTAAEIRPKIEQLTAAGFISDAEIAVALEDYVDKRG